MELLPKWIIKKERLNGAKTYAVYRRWLWWKKLHGRFSTKEEASLNLQYSMAGVQIERQID